MQIIKSVLLIYSIFTYNDSTDQKYANVSVFGFDDAEL